MQVVATAKEKSRDSTMLTTIGCRPAFLLIHEMSWGIHCISTYRLLIRLHRENCKLGLALFSKTASPARAQPAVYALGMVLLVLKIEERKLKNGMKLTTDVKITLVSVVIQAQMKLTTNSQSTKMQQMQNPNGSQATTSVNSTLPSHQNLIGDWPFTDTIQSSSWNKLRLFLVGHKYKQDLMMTSCDKDRIWKVETPKIIHPKCGIT